VTPLLEVSNVRLSFGGALALDDVSFELEPGECLGLIGPNGAGKSSLLNCISRSYKQDGGRIIFESKQLDRMKPHQVAAAGVARTFQNVELSPNRSVLRNTMIGAHTRMRSTFVENLVGAGRSASEERQFRQEAVMLLEQFGLSDVAQRPLGELPYGNRKMVEIARALLGRPRLMLLDEPVAGTSAEERAVIGEHFQQIASQLGLTTILVEHDVNFVRRIAGRMVVLDFGRVIATGKPDEVLRQPEVIAAYLGSGSSRSQHNGGGD
jgi:branched-chain amino acid transport system ATP-binding protein